MDDERIYRQIVHILSRGGRAALATVVAARGSTPRKLGAKLLMSEDGKTVGSVGGGVVEATVIEEAKRALALGETRLLEFSLDGKDLDSICGGEMSIFVETVGQSPELIARSFLMAVLVAL